LGICHFSLQAFCKGHPPFGDVVASSSNPFNQGVGLRVLGLHRARILRRTIRAVNQRALPSSDGCVTL
jgi:hypothetical protein